jgi:phage terminase large subunit
MFKYTTAIKKIRSLTKRKKVIQGGTSAGKTFGILPILIDKAARTPMLEISVVSESIPHLRRGAMKDFLKIMKLTNRYVDAHWNRSLLTYTFANGSYIEFFSADMDDKLRGARRNILYVNEANNVTFEAYLQLSIRTNKEIYIDFNPTQEFWAHTEVVPQEDADFLILNYQDNEALDENIVKEIESAKEKAKTSSYWENWWKVYGLGQIGSLQGAVFNNWKQIDKIPEEAKLIGIGLDFGYTNDPTAIVEVYNWNGQRIINELCYRSGMLNTDIAKILPSNVPIYADSSEPKSIEEIRRFGKTIRGVTKGKDSINYGIQVMQSQEYLVTSNSTNLIKELRGYIWDTDKSGTKLNKPIDYNNHCFVGSTLITTINGDVPINQIKVGDLVLTSQGYKKVLKTFNNGVKQVNKYSMQFDTFSVSLCSTKEHKIKTDKEWRKISELQKEDVLYQYKYSMGKSINFTMVKDILVEAQRDCMLKFGNIAKGKYQRDTMFTMLMETRTIIALKTLILFMQICILGLRVKRDSKIILSGLKTFTQKVLRKQKNGTNQTKVENGTKNTEKNVGLIENIKNWFVKFVAKNTKQDIQEFQNTAIQTAKLQHLDVGESWNEIVYDIMVEDCHEYFANGILVHNCIDSLRYHEMETIGLKNAQGKYYIY